jgi:hypothetical protein
MAKPINAVSPQEAEIGIVTWAQRYKAVTDEAESLADYADDTFTQENLEAGLLLQGINSEGGLVPWTSDQLGSARDAYALAREVADAARKPGPRDKPSLLRRIHGLIRSLGR